MEIHKLMKLWFTRLYEYSLRRMLTCPLQQSNTGWVCGLHTGSWMLSKDVKKINSIHRIYRNVYLWKGVKRIWCAHCNHKSNSPWGATSTKNNDTLRILKCVFVAWMQTLWWNIMIAELTWRWLLIRGTSWLSVSLVFSPKTPPEASHPWKICRSQDASIWIISA